MDLKQAKELVRGRLSDKRYEHTINKESDDAILSGDTDLSGAVTTDGQAAGTGQ